MRSKMRADKPAKIVALTQAEIDYVAGYASDSPVMIMLANTVAMARNEIRRINAEYVLEQATIPGADSMSILKEWKESRENG